MNLSTVKSGTTMSSIIFKEAPERGDEKKEFGWPRKGTAGENTFSFRSSSKFHSIIRVPPTEIKFCNLDEIKKYQYENFFELAFLAILPPPLFSRRFEIISYHFSKEDCLIMYIFNLTVLDL